jgi:hypothetical protein
MKPDFRYDVQELIEKLDFEHDEWEPALSPADKCQCFGPTLRWKKPGEGEGKVCLDDHGRATIEFEKVPKAAVGTAMTECWGADWFDEGPGGFADAEPGLTRAR